MSREIKSFSDESAESSFVFRGFHYLSLSSVNSVLDNAAASLPVYAGLKCIVHAKVDSGSRQSSLTVDSRTFVGTCILPLLDLTL